MYETNGKKKYSTHATITFNQKKKRLINIWLCQLQQTLRIERFWQRKTAQPGVKKKHDRAGSNFDYN